MNPENENEGLFHVIFDSALDGIVLADAETKRLVTGNLALCRMLGYSPEELTRVGVSDIHPQQDLPHVIDQFERQLRGEIQVAMDIPVKRKDGSIFFADIKSAPVRLGEKEYLVGIFRDITERKQAQHKQQRILDAVVHTITDMVKLRDPFIGSVQTRAAQLAQALATELQLPRQEVEGIRLAALLHGVGLVGIPASLLSRRTH